MRLSTQRIAYISLAVAIIAALSQISFNIGPVPLTLQTLAVGLTATLLHPTDALLAALIYLLLGGLGLPVFAGGSGGFEALFGPTAGFLWSFPLFALVTSCLTQKKLSIRRIALANLIGSLLVFLLGALYFSFYTKSDIAASLQITVLPFIPGDLIKVAIVSVSAPAIMTSLKQMSYFKSE